MPDDKGGVSRNGLNNLENEWRNYQRLTQYERNVQRGNVGILRDAKSGSDFNIYVRDELSKESDKTTCAINIAKDLAKDNRYLINAATDLEGRKGLQTLQQYLQRDKQGQSLSENIAKALSYWGKESVEAGKRASEQNEMAFRDNFPKYVEGLKKEAEKQGIQVDKVYSKEFTTGGKYEIRASVARARQVETMDGKKSKIYTGERDIRVGGFDTQNGKFIPASELNKLGTTEPSAIQPDDVVMLALAAKKAGEILFSQLGKGLAKETATLSQNLEKNLVKKGASELEGTLSKGLASEAKKIGDTASDLAKTTKVEKPQIREGSGGKLSRGGDTAQDLGDTLNLAELERKPLGETASDLAKTTKVEKPQIREGSGRSLSRGGDTAQDLGDTLVQPKIETNVASREASQLGRSPSSVPLYSDETIQYMGKDLTEKASEIGIGENELQRYITDTVYRSGKFELVRDGTWDAAQKAAKPIVEREIEKTLSLGEPTAKKLTSYGFDPSDVSSFLDARQAEGLTANQIKQHLDNELKMMDYLRDRLCGGSQSEARGYVGAAGNVREAIQDKIHDNLWNEWKNSTPNIDKLPPEMFSAKMRQFGERAAEMSKRLESRVLGSTPTRALTAGSLLIMPKKEKPDRATDGGGEGRKANEPKQDKSGEKTSGDKGSTQERGTSTPKDSLRNTSSQSEMKEPQQRSDRENRERARMDSEIGMVQAAMAREKGGSAGSKTINKEKGDSKQKVSEDNYSGLSDNSDRSVSRPKEPGGEGYSVKKDGMSKTMMEPLEGERDRG